MPTVIAIEAKPIEFQGVETDFFHLYLVKTVTDDAGRVLSEKVIRGTLGDNGSLETLANANLASSPDRRGSDTLRERHHTVLDLGTRDADDVWNVMVQHAVNIDKANLRYGFDVFQTFPGGDVNSNSVVASVLHSVGIDWTKSLPAGISKSEVPLYGQLQFMNVRDALFGTVDSDRILGGVGDDRLYGRGENDRLSGEGGNDRLYGSSGNDALNGGVGNDRLYGSSGDDKLSGSSGDDRLYGESGADILSGGSGKDAFIYNTIPDSVTGIDTIRDFSVVNDTFWLNNRVFTALGREGHLKSSAFWTGTEAHDATDRVIYDRAHGVLYYDPDGNGAAEQVTVAKLSTGLKMTNLDVLII